MVSSQEPQGDVLIIAPVSSFSVFITQPSDTEKDARTDDIGSRQGFMSPRQHSEAPASLHRLRVKCTEPMNRQTEKQSEEKGECNEKGRREDDEAGKRIRDKFGSWSVQSDQSKEGSISHIVPASKVSKCNLMSESPLEARGEGYSHASIPIKLLSLLNLSKGQKGKLTDPKGLEGGRHNHFFRLFLPLASVCESDKVRAAIPQADGESLSSAQSTSPAVRLSETHNTNI
ncbi:unnamed protein product [Pleuronectes platessa]|uniref:Uncharacterized protein n=1 Tax=Pleuronectes platessa TaxID=8262 RepID=A0A9N7W0C6_PLEPL|nr:unnamed protein product [Pleuronectes platessa]